MQSTLRIIFLGTPSYLNPIINSLKENFELTKVIRSTNEDLNSLKDLEFDLLIVASFGKIIPSEILKLPKLGSINIHPSKLPQYRGPSPIQSQILDGVKDSAISFILMDQEMDHGPVLHQEPFTILEEDTFESLCTKMFGKSAEVVSRVIKDFNSGEIKPREQNHEEATFCDVLKKEDGYFEIDKPPNKEKLNKMIRAYYPWPGVWTRWNGKIVKLLPEGRIQIEGKKAVTLKEFLNGYPDFPLKKLSLG